MSTTAVQGPDDVLEVLLGVDTHLDVHVAAVLDQLGRPLDELRKECPRAQTVAWR
jgi:hypothetical protein